MKVYIFCVLLAQLLIFPTLVSAAYTSVIAEPKNPSVILPILEPQRPQEFFGVLDGFPHTYTFIVAESTPFKATLSAFALREQHNDVSIIIVKAEKRGVSEVGRTNIKESTWKESYDALLAMTFKEGGALEALLDPGVYTLEVSSPNNDAVYRLDLGNDAPSYSYFDHLRRLFEVQALVSSPWYTVFISPLVYVPIVLLLIGVATSVYVYIRKKQIVHTL